MSGPQKMATTWSLERQVYVTVQCP